MADGVNGNFTTSLKGWEKCQVGRIKMGVIFASKPPLKDFHPQPLFSHHVITTQNWASKISENSASFEF